MFEVKISLFSVGHPNQLVGEVAGWRHPDPDVTSVPQKGGLLTLIKEFSNIPLEHTKTTPNQQFMKEFLSFGGLGKPGVCSRGMLSWGSLRINDTVETHRFLIQPTH